MIEENCIICERPIHRSRNKQGKKLNRGIETVTCGKPCARAYLRIRARIVQLTKRQLTIFKKFFIKLQEKELQL